MGNEISGHQKEVSTKYNIPLEDLQKWYHGDYINFLQKEIAEGTWKNGKYGKNMKDKDGYIHETGKQFCKWKEIQKEIFEAVLDNHRFLLYTWEDRAKHLVDEAQLNVAARETCEKDDENKSQDNDLGGAAGTSVPDTNSGQTVDLKGCLPKRRETINTRLRTIKKYIQGIKDQTNATEEAKAQSAAATIIGSLAIQTGNEIDEIIKKKSHNYNQICKLIGRTYADYKDISKGKDIVKDPLSQEIQKNFKEIVDKIGGENEMDKLWETYFKNTIEVKLKELKIDEKGSNNEKPCTLDHSDEKAPQCLRYMQEYLEEFIQTKIMLEWYIRNICNSKDKYQKNKCGVYCREYMKFLDGRKTCYQIYKKQCKKNLKNVNHYSDDSVYNANIQSIERGIKDKIGCDKGCGTDGSLTLDPIFNVNDSSTNKSYYCNCNGHQNKDKPPCNDKKQKHPMSLKGEWKEGIHSNQQTKPSNACGLQFGLHNSVGGGGADPCSGVWDTTTWKCDGRDVREEGICLPPRRQEICLSNIRNLGNADISDMNSNKLLLEIMLAAKQQAWRVHNNYKNKNRQLYQRGTNACEAIKRSFYDFGDIIKGIDKANDKDSKDVERKLKAIFTQIREQWRNSGNTDTTKYDDTNAFDGLKKLRSDWWDANKDKIWEAFRCNNGISECGNLPHDSRSQFLRWLDEWANEFCNERKKKERLVEGSCGACTNGECSASFSTLWSYWFSPPGPICDCKNQCKSYSNWIATQKSQFDTQAKYYDEKITSMDFGGTSDGSHSGTTKSSVSEYLKNEVSSRCNDIDFSKPQTIFSSYPDETSKYRHRCSKCYAQLEADLTYKDGTEKNVCIVDKILTKHKSSHITHYCNDNNIGEKVKNNDNTEWKNKKIGKTYKTIYGIPNNDVNIPPRYEDICKDTIDDSHKARTKYVDEHDYYDNNRMLLSELILIAKHEGKSLRKYFSDLGAATSNGQNDKRVMCTAMRRSFADIGDIVKGTSIIHNENDDVEKHLKEMFDKLRNEYYTFSDDSYKYGYRYDDNGLVKFRNNWWERNRHIIWEAFKCGQSENICDDHMDMDNVPQLLRWITEWSEKFCIKQKEQFAQLKNACNDCKDDKGGRSKCAKDTQKCQKCANTCKEYRNFINKWSNQWKKYDQMYTNLYEKALISSDAIPSDSTYIRKLIRENKLPSLSPSAATYVHLTMKSNDCVEQTDFGNINEDKYALKEIPKGYDDACKCEEDDKSQKDMNVEGDDGDTSSETKTNLCEKTYDDIKYEEWDCNKKDENDNQVCKKKENSNNNVSDDFHELFNAWVQSFLKEYETFKENVKECTNNASGKNVDQSTCPNDNCRDKCYCYKKWEINRIYEWGKQKEYFEEYKNKMNTKSAGANLGGLEYLDNLETYMTFNFGSDLKNLLSDSKISLQELQEQLQKYDAITQILMKSEKLISECENKCPKKLDCNDKGFTNDWKCNNMTPKKGAIKDMCLRTGDANTSNVSNNDEFFFFVFNDWLQEISQNMRHHINMLEETCDNKIIEKNKKDNPNICNECKNNCECYKTWKDKIDEQWEKQKVYYETYKKQKSEMNDIDLNTYLEALCETMTDKNGYVQEDECTLKDAQASDNDIFSEKLKSLDSNKENICAVCPEDNMHEKQKTEQKVFCDDIKTKHIFGQCNTKEYDDVSNGNKRKKDWTTEARNKEKEIIKEIRVPPRRQQLCVSYIKENGNIKSDEDLKKYLKASIMNETKQLLTYYKTPKPVTGNGNSQSSAISLPVGFCKAVERSFADLGDFVKGTNLDYTEDSKTVNEKIESVFQQQKTKLGDRKTWWEKHKRELWKAVKCGINDGKDGLDCPQNIDFDRRDQFLRWFEEWGNYFYKEYQKKMEQIKTKCENKGQNNNCAGGNTTGQCNKGCPHCEQACNDYKNWIQPKKKEKWKNLEKKYKEDQTSNKYTDYDNMADILSASAYLNFSCMGDKCPYINYPYVIDLRDKEYKSYCDCDSDEYKNRVQGKDGSTSSATINPCNLDKTNFGCNKKIFGKYWSPHHVEDQVGKKIYGVYRPPRRQKLCIANIIQYSTKDNLLENVLLDAQNEANLILDYYKKEYINIKDTEEKNFPGSILYQKACRAIKRSFYDFGDIIKGTDMENAPYSNYARTRLKDTFTEIVRKEKASSNLKQQQAQKNAVFTPSEEEIIQKRKKWWDDNKDTVWKAMNCDKKNNCEATTPSDTTPQFLRWLEEWYEEFCTDRTNLLGNIKKGCRNKKSQSTCDPNEKECQDACTKYSNWITSKKLEWKAQKLKYQKTYQDVKLNPENDEFKKATKDNPSPEKYFKDKYSEIKCNRNEVENMDKIVDKKDDKYMNDYEPLCSHCKFTKILDKAKEKHQKKNAAVTPDQGKQGSGNPCAKPSGSQPAKSVEVIAKEMQEEAKREMEKNSVVGGGENKLKGDISQAKFKNNETGQKLATNICNLDKTKHTNDGRPKGEPCTGKGNTTQKNIHTRFVVGVRWQEDKGNMHPNHTDVIMPPRRRHICTSNLENLYMNYDGLTGTNVNHSFFGDVLLTAKEEANKIIDMYKEKNGPNVLNEQKHKETVCQAMKYSFADIGDIILGRDLWNKESGNKKLQEDLVKIFEKIEQNLSSSGNNKYQNGQSEEPPYAKLREHWWALNRDQVWNAMKCGYNGSVQCDGDNITPHEDYIPQKLRWMIEWAEWFCKAQKDEYDKLVEACDNCKGVNKGTSCANCKECKDACGKYGEFITKWKEDWQKMETKYKILYQQAKHSSTSTSNDPNLKYLDEFLYKLRTENGSNTTYESAEGYVHQELKNMNCVEQTKFCGNNNDQDYAFMDKPHDYEKACECIEPTIPAAPQPPPGVPSSTQKEPCDIVKDTLKNEARDGKIENCKPKYYTGTIYPDWDCGEGPKSTVSKDGECMPPRRQKLCLHKLEKLNTSNEDNLRTALIQCAAIETFLAWKKYKEDKQNEKSPTATNLDPQNQLNSGTIPDEFKRIMLYTYGDFRDLCLDKDISITQDSTRGVGKVKKNINEIFSNNGNNSSGQTREAWWNSIQEEVWDAMVCSLSYDSTEKTMDTATRSNLESNKFENVTFDGSGTKLDKFAERPQFLRWLTEWYDDYCHKKHTKLQDVVTTCKTVGDNQFKCDNKNCETKCTEYENFMKGKQTEWGKQKDYYAKQQKQKTSGYEESDAKEYLKKNFTVKCGSTSSGSTSTEVQKNIDLLQQPQVQSSSPYYDADKYCGCKKFIDENKYTDLVGQGNCKGLMSDIDKNGIKWQNNKDKEYQHLVKDNYKNDPVPEEVYIPPRRQRICFQDIDKSNEVTDKSSLQKQLMKVSATEGHNLGKYYKEKANNGTSSDKYAYDVEASNALKYSFLDLRDIIIGTDNLEPEDTNTGKNLKKIFDKESSGNGGTPGSPERQKWWNENQKCVWNAMKCGYKKSGNADDIQNCGTDPPSNKDYPIGDNRDQGKEYQFLRWFTEWSEDFCKKYHVQLGKLDSACKSCKPTNTGGKTTCGKECNDCRNACEEYSNFIKKWSDQYENQSKKYSDDKKKKAGSYDLDKDAKSSNTAREFLEKKLKGIKCDSKTSGTNDCNCMENPSTQPQNSGNTPKSLENPPSEYESKCECANKVKPPAPQPPLNPPGPQGPPVPTPTISSACGTKRSEPKHRSIYQMDCTNLNTANNNNNTCETKRDITGEKLKTQKLNKIKSYIPERTKQLCLNNIETLGNGTMSNNVDEKQFSQALQKDAYNEAKLLREYYKENKTILENDNSALKDKKINEYTLEAMKRSYGDYADLIKGTTEYDYNGKKKKIDDFITKQLNYDNSNGNKREELWNKYKADIWNAMLCAYKESSNSENLDQNICELPKTDETVQLLRWFTEWAEHFCFHRKIHSKKLEEHCSFTNCQSASSQKKSECLNACRTYDTFIKNWEQAYTIQEHTYNILNDKIVEIKGKATPQYLSSKCADKCSCFNNKDVNSVDELFQNPPTKYQNNCNCPPPPPRKTILATKLGKAKQLPPQPPNDEKLNTCPLDETTCSYYGDSRCKPKKILDVLDEWNDAELQDRQTKNKGILIPPRRRQLCFTERIKGYRNIKNEKEFKKEILKGAVMEGKGLGEYYNKHSTKALEDMKNSFFDYGDIIKGNDMMDNNSKYIKGKLEKVITNTINGTTKPDDWWTQNKTHIWHAMLCGYHKSQNNKNGQFDQNWCDVPNDDIPQFLRWLTEWYQQFCEEKLKMDTTITEGCKTKLSQNANIPTTNNLYCKDVIDQYKKWHVQRHKEWEGLKEQYKTNFANNQSSMTETGEPDPHTYVKKYCNTCNCNINDLDYMSKKIQNQNNDPNLDSEIISKVHSGKDFPKKKLQDKPFIETLISQLPTLVVDATSDILPRGIAGTIKTAEIGLKTSKMLLEEFQKYLPSIKIEPHNTNPKPNKDNDNVPTKPQDDTVINDNSTKYILSATAVTITGIISLLLYKFSIFGKKNIPTRHVDDMIRILEMPQNDYGMPDKTSTNRYIPYGQYKGKTYIYVEGEETDDYIRDISSSDITSSSESEYEEMDINDIYKPRSPKYKTLIEVILKPSSKTHDDTSMYHMEDTSHTPTNKLTDEEWNQLKDYFIYQYLQNIEPDVPINNKLQTDNMNKDIQPKIIDVNNDEKPFITSIHDRVLHGDSEITYNIDWNIPKNTQIYTTDIPTYFSQNLYSGTDLINDSLNSNEHIDIYDELLKRKENELFGTKYTKHTTTKSVSKQIYYDPINNQIDLFHKCLDRHRDMCEKWSNKEEMLNKLNEEWNKENNIHMSKDIYDENNHKVHLIHEEYNLNNIQNN